MPEQQLSYYIPQNGRKKVTLRIPDSHSLYICPPACGRRSGIRAIKNGEKKHISFLYLTQAQLSSGEYETLIGDAVGELLSLLEPQPRVIELYFNCVDDFLGTDEQALIHGLELRFPERRFVAMHINPIAYEEKVKPGMALHAKLYTLLSPAEKDAGINFIGSFVPLDEDNELFEVLSGWGVMPVRQLCRCRSFEEYEQLSSSSLNIVLHEMGSFAAQKLEERLGTPWLFLPASYRISEIRAQYAALARALGEPVPVLELDVYEKLLTDEAEKTVRKLAEREIVVDSGSSIRPCNLARGLLELGLNVRAVFLLHSKDSDAEDQRWLEENCPGVRFIRQESYEEILASGLSDKSVCVGYDSAYLLRSKSYVDVYHDEGLFGYYGLCKILRGLGECVERESEEAEK